MSLAVAIVVRTPRRLRRGRGPSAATRRTRTPPRAGLWRPGRGPRPSPTKSPSVASPSGNADHHALPMSRLIPCRCPEPAHHHPNQSSVAVEATQRSKVTELGSGLGPAGLGPEFVRFRPGSLRPALSTQYANNRIENDHSRLKARLRPMRGLKPDRTASVVIRGHAFIQNLRRGHHEMGIDALPGLTVAAVFDEPGPAI